MTAFIAEPGDDLCPPYWPALLWWLIHHGPNPPGPWVEKLDENLAVLSIHALTQRVGDEQIAEGVRTALSGHAGLALAE